MPHHHVKACLKMESDLSLKLWQIIKGHRSTKKSSIFASYRYCKICKTKMDFFENVCRLFNFNDIDKNGKVEKITKIIENEFREIGYAGKFEQVQMADYGLPQTRLRSVGILG